MRRFLYMLTIVLATLVALPALALPSETPRSDTVGYSDGAVRSTEAYADNVIWAGTGDGTKVTDATGTILKVHIPRDAYYATHYGSRTVVLGTANGYLERWGMDGERDWSVPFGGRVEVIDRIRNTPYFVVGGRNPSRPLAIHDARTGERVSTLPVTGTVTGGDLSPDGRKYIAIGKHMKIGGRDRPHIGIVNIAADGRSGSGSSWNHVKSNKHCSGSRNPDYAHITDVEWGPSGTPMAGRFVAVSTGGGNRNYSRGMCDSAWMLYGRANRTESNVLWWSRTCNDTYHSVAIDPSGQYVAVAGHQKCAEWIATHDDRDVYRSGEEYGLNPNAPYRLDGPIDYGKAANRMGLAILNRHGDLVEWESHKCRAVGAQGLDWNMQALYVGFDCERWGNEEAGFLPPGYAPEWRLRRMAVLPN